jgi:hypothetical protein
MLAHPERFQRDSVQSHIILGDKPGPIRPLQLPGTCTWKMRLTQVVRLANDNDNDYHSLNVDLTEQP